MFWVLTPVLLIILIASIQSIDFVDYQSSSITHHDVLVALNESEFSLLLWNPKSSIILFSTFTLTHTQTFIIHAYIHTYLHTYNSELSQKSFLKTILMVKNYKYFSVETSISTTWFPHVRISAATSVNLNLLFSKGFGRSFQK